MKKLAAPEMPAKAGRSEQDVPGMGKSSLLDFETISILADSSAVGAPDYSIPIEEFFPPQLAD